MAIQTSATWLQLGSTSFLSAIVPIVVGGGLAVFKPWLPSEDDVRNRVIQRKLSLLENVCKLFHRVLIDAVTAGLVSLDPKALKELRGAPPKEPDVIGDHTAELFRVFAVVHELDGIQSAIKTHYTWLFITAAIGLISLIAAIPLESLRPWIAIVCYTVIVTQLYSVGFIRHLAKQLERYERTT